MKSKAPIHFILEVFDRIHNEDYGLHGNSVIVWLLNHLTVDLLVCFGSLLCWNTHSFEFHN